MTAPHASADRCESSPEAPLTEHCITCGDSAEAMRVMRVDEQCVLALCEDAGGARHTVETALVGEVAPGDMLLVHAGTAIARDDAQAVGPRDLASAHPAGLAP